MSLKGNNYAKVAERLKLFREDHPKGKTESVVYSEGEETVFTVYLWKEKSELLELIKAGITD